MSFEQGRLVAITAGRGKGRIYAVVGCENERVLIADGKTRLCSNPKRKSLRHIKAQELVLPEQMLKNDKQLRVALAAYAETAGSSVQGG